MHSDQSDMSIDRNLINEYRILHIISGLDVGGAETMLLKLIEKQSKKCASITVVCLRTTGVLVGAYESAGADVRCLGLEVKSPLSVWRIFRLMPLIWDIRPDVIQGWMYHGNLAATIANFFFLSKSQLYWNIRQTIDGLQSERLLTRGLIKGGRFFSSFPEAIIYNSYRSALQHEQLGYKKDLRKIIPNGFEMEKFQPLADCLKRDVKASLGLPNDARIIGHVARYHSKKDHKTFLFAMEKVLEKSSNTRVIVVGRNVTLENEEIKDQVAGFLCLDQMNFLGERRDIPALMGIFDLFVSSSSAGEGFPNTIGEAMASGVPCVATDVGESSTIVGNCGWIVRPGNFEELAHVVIDLLGKPSAYLKGRGQRGRERVALKYNIRDIERQYFLLYSSQMLELL